MKLHTNTADACTILQTALDAAKSRNLIADHVDFDILSSKGSRSHRFGADFHLATYKGGRGTTHPRRTNSGQYGANDALDGYAAHYAEWGYLMVEIFRIDPTARIGHYKTLTEFYEMTDHNARAAILRGEKNPQAKYPRFERVGTFPKGMTAEQARAYKSARARQAPPQTV